MSLKELTKESNPSTLQKGFSKVLKNKAKKLTLPLISAFVLLQSVPAQAYDYRNVQLTNPNGSTLEQLWTAMDMGSSTQLNEEVDLLDERIKTVVITLDADVKELPSLNEYNIPVSAYSHSHMDMVEKSLTKNLNYIQDNDVSIMNVNIYSGEYEMINTAYNNIENVLEHHPEKNFIINMSLAGGQTPFGNVRYHDKIINLIKNYPNIKIIKSAGNSSINERFLNTLVRAVKPELSNEFRDYMISDNTTLTKEELSKFFLDSEDGYIDYCVSHFSEVKEIIDIKEENFKESLVFIEKLHAEFSNENNSQEEILRLQTNLVLALAYSPADFVNNYKSNPELKQNKDAQEIYDKLRKIGLTGGMFSFEKYQFNFNEKNKDKYDEFERLFTDFVFNYQDTNPEFFRNGYVNASIHVMEGSNFKFAPTDMMREHNVKGQKLKYLSMGTSTSAPIITSKVIDEVRNETLVASYTQENMNSKSKKSKRNVPS